MTIFWCLWDPGWIYPMESMNQWVLRQKNSQIISRTHQISAISNNRKNGENNRSMAQKYQISMPSSRPRFLYTLDRQYESKRDFNNWGCCQHPQKATQPSNKYKGDADSSKRNSSISQPLSHVINFEARYRSLWHFYTSPPQRMQPRKPTKERCKISSPRSNSS